MCVQRLTQTHAPIRPIGIVNQSGIFNRIKRAWIIHFIRFHTQKENAA